MLDIFDQDAFSIVRLTARVNDLPYVPGQISASGLFRTDGIDTTAVAIEKRPNGLAIVAPSPRGGPGETITIDEDSLYMIRIPHFQRDDAVTADEVQGRRAFGRDGDLETVLQRLDRKAMRHLQDFDATIEHQRVGATKGIITDKFGNTMLNLFTTFGIAAPAPIAFHLDDAAQNLRTTVRNVRYVIEDAIDTTYTGIDAWCGKTFYSMLIDHPSIVKTYLNTIAAAELRGKTPDEFPFEDVTFHRYRTGRKAVAANSNSPYIGDNECRFVLRGVPGLFETIFGPADYNETVNTMGLPRYMKLIPKRDDKGYELQVQTNPISYCTRPESLFSAVATQ